MNVEETKPAKGEGHRGHNPHHVETKVLVKVDGNEHRVTAGDYVVSRFKELVGVDAGRELDEVIHGELRPLKDEQIICIRGGEVFISHARGGGSS
jgi:hypothetical protein